jgi:uncharacterized protein
VSAHTVVRQLYEYVASGNIPAVIGMLDEDAVFVQAPSLPFGGEWHGPEGFLQMAEKIGASWPGFQAIPRSFFPNESGEVAVHVSLTGQGLAMDMMELWTVRDDKIVRCQPFYFDAAVAARTAEEFIA